MKILKIQIINKINNKIKLNKNEKTDIISSYVGFLG